jgi:hypothetical protein
MVAGNVAGGKGFTEEVGSLKIVITTMTTMTVAIKTRTERTSQILMFNFMCRPPQTGISANNRPFVSISDFESMSSKWN